MKAENSSDAQILEKIDTQTQSLIGAYQKVGVHFANLHDTSKRLLVKGCINDIVLWQTSRHTFYWRLKRLLIEDFFIKQICSHHNGLSVTKAKCKFLEI